MEHQTGSLVTPDGIHLFTRRWTPAGPPRGTVVLVHGIAEHSGRYAHVASRLLLAGYAVFAYDQRGHGQSGGDRAYVESFAVLPADLALFLKHIEPQRPDGPLFLLGHSLGGLVAVHYVGAFGPEALDGLVLSSPGIGGPNVPALLVKASGLLSRYTPRLPVVKLELDALSRDPTVVRAYREDPLNTLTPTRARMARTIYEAMQASYSLADRFTLPVYAFQGTADRITSLPATEAFMDAVPTSDKTLKRYPRLYHETMNEPEREVVLDDLVAWLDAHTDAPPGP